MSLSTLDENEPGGFASVDKGAGEIRLTRKDTKDSVALQHYLSGEHRFPNADVTASAVGQIALNDGRLMYGTGPGWQTSSFHVENFTGGAGTHVTSTTLVEVAGFVTAATMVGYSIWATGTMRGTKPDTFAAPSYEMSLVVGSTTLVSQTILPGGAALAGVTQTPWYTYLLFRSDSTFTINAGTRISLRARVVTTSPAGVSMDLMNDANIVVLR